MEVARSHISALPDKTFLTSAERTPRPRRGAKTVAGSPLRLTVQHKGEGASENDHCQKNFRLSEYHAGMLAWFSRRFGVSETEIVRRALDQINSDYELALTLAKNFIKKLNDRYGADARIELRLADDQITADVLVDGELAPDLTGYVRLGPLEERAAGIERYRLYLSHRGDDGPYGAPVLGI